MHPVWREAGEVGKKGSGQAFNAYKENAVVLFLPINDLTAGHFLLIPSTHSPHGPMRAVLGRAGHIVLSSEVDR